MLNPEIAQLLTVLNQAEDGKDKLRTEEWAMLDISTY